MRTYEMVGVADDNTRTYESEYGSYNKAEGFKLNSYAEELPKEKLLYDFFHNACWVLRKDVPKRKKMTQKEIEEELGYLIEIDDGEEENKSPDKDMQNYASDLNDLLRIIFGLED